MEELRQLKVMVTNQDDHISKLEKRLAELESRSRSTDEEDVKAEDGPTDNKDNA